MNSLKRLLKNDDAVTVVEIVLILVVLIALVIIFKSQLTSIIQNIFDKISKSANSI